MLGIKVMSRCKSTPPCKKSAVIYCDARGRISLPKSRSGAKCSTRFWKKTFLAGKGPATPTAAESIRCLTLASHRGQHTFWCQLSSRKQRPRQPHVLHVTFSGYARLIMRHQLRTRFAMRLKVC